MTKYLLASLLMIASSFAAFGANENPTQPITVIATVKTQPGTQAAFQAAAEPMVDLSRQDDGNLGYRLVRSQADPTEFATIETWRSQADIDRHMASPHMQQFFKQVGNLFAPGFPTIKTYELELK